MRIWNGRRRIKKLQELSLDPTIDLWAMDEVHFQQHGSRCRMGNVGYISVVLGGHPIDERRSGRGGGPTVACPSHQQWPVQNRKLRDGRSEFAAIEQNPD